MIPHLRRNASKNKMNHKRHNQGLRAHTRRKNLSGYWLPKWARENKLRVSVKVARLAHNQEEVVQFYRSEQ